MQISVSGDDGDRFCGDDALRGYGGLVSFCHLELDVDDLYRLCDG